MKNKAKNAGNLFTRKFGPLPAWAWLTIFAVGVWYYRNKLGATASGTGTGSVAPAPATPQAGQVLQPGESYYDPNTGALTTAPGSSGTASDGLSGTNTTAPDLSSFIDALTGAINAGEAAALGAGGTSSAGATGTPPTSATPANAITKPKLTAKGAIYAPFGHAKPAARQGYTIKGLGKGYWEYLPTKRAKKPKNQHGTPAATTRTPRVAPKSKPRSTSNVRNQAGGTTRKKSVTSAKPGRLRGGAKPHASQARTMSARRGTPLVTRPVVRQRPVASATPRSTTAARPAPRPSSPPPRAARTVSKPAPRPAPKRKR